MADWKKEAARDCIALGSIPFYFIVIVRALIGPYTEFVFQLLIALAIIYLLSLFIKSETYSARSLILLIFTSLFYQETIYTIFAFLLWILILFSLDYLKTKKQAIIKGIALALFSSALAYYLTSLIV